MVSAFVLTPRSIYRVLEYIRKYGAKESPRGIPTWELLNASLTLKDPIDRVVPDRARRMNIAFAIAEWFSFMYGVDDITFFQQFIKGYDKFSSDGKTLDGCYGTRVNFEPVDQSTFLHGEWDNQYWYPEGHANQVAMVIDKLRQDPSSRQAVISIYAKEDLLGAGGKNTPCTLTLQFLLRDGKLNAIVNMRSSDVVKGLTYDVFVFTMVQEYVARQLGVELGKYHHNAGSLHLYESDEKILSSIDRSYRWPKLMNAMPRLENVDMVSFRKIVLGGLEDDRAFNMLAYDPQAWTNDKTREYLVGLAATMKSFVYRYTNIDKSLEAHDMVLDTTVKFVLRQWLFAAGIHSPSHLLHQKQEEDLAG